MPRIVRAHDLTAIPRTEDVAAGEDVEFSSLLLSGPVSEGLKRAGFKKPSPIQLKAIPLAKLGFDVIAQAKSGTGKTCVFTVALLEAVDVTVPAIQGLVLAPTREIAVQIRDTIVSIGRLIKGLGGLSVVDDIKHGQTCHIAVGTPGRVKALLETSSLPCDRVRMFVLDEADKLLERKLRDQINYIYSMLPERKQMLALSATYPAALAEALSQYMRDPIHVRIDAENPSLHGVRQYYTLVKGVDSNSMPHEVFVAKSRLLANVLQAFPFRQCMVFSNYRDRAEQLAEALSDQGWACAYISGAQAQGERLGAMAKLYAFKLRVLVSTDLTSRGIDLDAVDLVVNLDLPYDAETYLHRIGRSGRFGAQGTAVSIVTGPELHQLQRIWAKYHTDATEWVPPVNDSEASVPAQAGSAANGETERDDIEATEMLESHSPDASRPMKLKDKLINSSSTNETQGHRLGLSAAAREWRPGMTPPAAKEEEPVTRDGEQTGDVQDELTNGKPWISDLSLVTDDQLEALLAQSIPVPTSFPIDAVLPSAAQPFQPTSNTESQQQDNALTRTGEGASHRKALNGLLGDGGQQPAITGDAMATQDPYAQREQHVDQDGLERAVEAQRGDDSDMGSSALSDGAMVTDDGTGDQWDWAALNEYYWRSHWVLGCDVCRRHYAQYGIELD